MVLRALANQLLSTLFEPPCAGCRRRLSTPLNGAVCEDCWSQLGRAVRLIDRQRGGGVDWSCAVDRYDGRMKEIIHALKYERRRSIAPPLADLMRASGAELLSGADMAVPVPLHPRREYERGFNQADDLARHLGLPVAPLLKRVRFTTSQVELPRERRRENVKNAFAIGVPLAPRVVPAIAVIVDDVSTTGSTLEACARVLKAAGVKEVRALTAARVANRQ
ncbi:MAG TPA: ComF family protein [Vicinamibacterales bacterium]|nr:ComF family protein [Vicinamibacterales bacterium]